MRIVVRGVALRGVAGRQRPHAARRFRASAFRKRLVRAFGSRHDSHGGVGRADVRALEHSDDRVGVERRSRRRLRCDILFGVLEPRSFPALSLRVEAFSQARGVYSFRRRMGCGRISLYSRRGDIVPVAYARQRIQRLAVGGAVVRVDGRHGRIGVGAGVQSRRFRGLAKPTRARCGAGGGRGGGSDRRVAYYIC